MKVLFTGGSSFTGYWFAKQLAAAGYDVVVLFRRQPHEYSDALRRSRVEALAQFCRPVFGVSFGDGKFFELINSNNWDLLCHHAADVTNYRSADFDVAAAVQNNTLRLPSVLDSLGQAG